MTTILIAAALALIAAAFLYVTVPLLLEGARDALHALRRRP